MNFKAGLILPAKRGFKRLALSPTANGEYIVPSHLDARSRLLPSSNQGQTSQCVAYAVAGFIEFNRWKYQNRVDQIDPHPIYNRAKQIDGLGGGDGTTLEAGVQAAADLGLIPNPDNIRAVTEAAEVQRALHRFDVMVGAFTCTTRWMSSTHDGWIDGGGVIVGGHAVLLTGYSLNDYPPFYQFQNSWGEGQGWRGFNRIRMDVFEEQFIYGLVWGDSG